jgi:hypothetical protein
MRVEVGYATMCDMEAAQRWRGQEASDSWVADGTEPLREGDRFRS